MSKIVMVNPFISEEYKEKVTQLAAKYGATVEFFSDNVEALKSAEDAEIIFAMSPMLVEKAKNLRWFCSASAGIDHLASSGVFDGRDILLTNSSGTFGLTIAEHIIMVTLMMMRRYPEYEKHIQNKEWLGGLEQRSIFGSKFLVLGTGDLGMNFAKRVRSLEPASVIGVSRSGAQVDGFDQVYPISQLDSLLGDIDVLVMCLPGTAETIGILSRGRIALLPEKAFVVNVGRGSAIDEAALMEALEEEKIAGAALDVFTEEPLPANSPLWDVKNLLITPHISGQNTLEWTRNRNIEMFCEDIANYFEGRPLTYTADIKAGY